jgi:hypothetical protein
MGERREKAGAPDDRVHVHRGPVDPRHASSREARERLARDEHAARPGINHRRHHDDVAESALRRKHGASLLLRLPALRRPTEQDTTVHIVGQEHRRTLGHPGGLGNGRYLREDLRARVAAADNQHAPSGEGFRPGVVTGVHPGAREDLAAGIRRNERRSPRARGAHDDPRQPGSPTGAHVQSVACAFHRIHPHGAEYGDLIAVLVSRQVVNHVVAGRKTTAGGRHGPARERTGLRRRKEAQ